MNQEPSTLLFIHGWATDNRVWANQVKYFKDRYKIANINLPGHGGKEAWEKPTQLAPVQEVLRQLPILAQNKNVDNGVVGIGWSLGAQTLLSMAIENKVKFAGLVLVNATPCFVKRKDFPWGQEKVVVEKMIKDMKKKPVNTVKRFYKLNFTEDELKRESSKSFISNYINSGKNFKFNDIITALESLLQADLREGMNAIEIPTLIIHGEMDQVCSVEASYFLKDKIKGSELIILKKTGHAPFITKEEKFTKVVLEFLEKLKRL